MLPPVDEESGAEEVRVFFNELRELHAEPYLLQSQAETLAILRAILSKTRCEKVVLSGLPAQVRPLALKAAEGITCHEVENLAGPDASRVISQADVGITWAERGVAEVGAVMEVAFDDAAKLVSSLPLNHVVMLSAKRILPRLSDAVVEAGRLIQSSPKEGKPVITFISGPSKTGDIEMRLLYGVHGPNAVHVLTLGWL